jgi:hypothetical protein
VRNWSLRQHDQFALSRAPRFNGESSGRCGHDDGDACHAIDLGAATADTLGLMEHAIFREVSSIAARRRAGSFSPKTS